MPSAVTGNTTEPHVHFQIQSTAGFYSCLGLPLRFSHIQTKFYSKYSLMDTRPLPKKEDLREGCIHRGLFKKIFNVKKFLERLLKEFLFYLVILFIIQCCLCCCKSCDRHTVWAA